ncbi:hypothetical protein R1flu_005487 [Riccia fluitans]|uniref:Uncharacterized protein n=1 Tax=Riccia fluitans TaxID=41844 RepID=A0ABD1YTB7_9MARC
MWGGETFARGPGGHFGSKSAPCSPVKPFQKRAPAQQDSFHVIHKVPLGDSPYVKAKHTQLVDKDPDAAIALFWAAINANDRVDSALKDMAIVMKQQNRPEEAIEAIKSLRYRCSDAAQESLDNVLLDLYKRCGRLDDQIALLKHKLHLIHQGMAFNGKRTKTARSQGKKFQVSIEQEATRLLGNLGWAYMQQSNFTAAEAVYRKALSIGPDNNKVCNLGICLMKQGRLEEAKAMLQSVVPACPDTRWGSDSHLKSYERAQEMLLELEASIGRSNGLPSQVNSLLQSSLWQPQASSSYSSATTSSVSSTASKSHKTLEAKNDSMCQDLFFTSGGALSATAGFGPATTAVPLASSGRPMQKKPFSSAQEVNQARQQRPRTAHDLGGPTQFKSFQNANYNNDVWDEFDSEFEPENVDGNIQGVPQNFTSALFQQMQQWPGEALHQQRQRSEALRADANLLGIQPQLPLGSKRVERALNFSTNQSNTTTYNSSGSSLVNNNAGLPAGLVRRDVGLNENQRLYSSALQDQSMPLTYDRAKLYKAIEEESKLTTDSWGNPQKSPLGNSELSFFTRWGYNENQNQRLSSVRRSLSLENFDTQLELIALENEEAADEANDITFQQQPPISQHPQQIGTQVKRPRNSTPGRGNSMWAGSLGFFHDQAADSVGYARNEQLNDLDYKSMVVGSAAANSATLSSSQPQHVHSENRILSEKQQNQPMSTLATGADMEAIKRQRRLRVFQEITLYPGSPQHA